MVSKATKEFIRNYYDDNDGSPYKIRQLSGELWDYYGIGGDMSAKVMWEYHEEYEMDRIKGYPKPKSHPWESVTHREFNTLVREVNEKFSSIENKPKSKKPKSKKSKKSKSKKRSK